MRRQKTRRLSKSKIEKSEDAIMKARGRQKKITFI